MNLSGATVAVTGAGGFIGGRVAHVLATRAGARVLGIDVDARAGAALERDGGVLRTADLRDPAATRAALAGADAVVHTAARVAETGPMEEFVAINVRGTRNVLDAAGDVPVVHVSSVAVWGYDFAADLHEDAHPRRTGLPYIDTKAASDRLAARRGATVVRPGDVYGPRSGPWTVRPLDLIRRRLLVLPGGGAGLMTPIYVDDLVDGIVAALGSSRARGATMTLWDGRPVTAAEFFGHYARMLGRSAVPTAPAPIVTGAVHLLAALARARGREPHHGPPGVTYVSRRAAFPNAIARERLDWVPAVDLDEGMRRTEVWLRAEGLLPAP